MTSEPSIPILAYAFIGITTLVLTYVTVMDNGSPNIQNNGPASMTSLLPSVGQSATPSASAQSSVPVAVAVPATPSLPNMFQGPLPKTEGPQLKIGGKTKGRKNKNKNTKRRKH
jgi:hypothetical protein